MLGALVPRSLSMKANTKMAANAKTIQPMHTTKADIALLHQ